MTWGKLLQPDLVLGNTIFALTPAILQQYQLQGLVLDVDETLVPFRDSQATPDLQEWCTQINASVPIWLVSNNVNEGRIRRIAESLDVPYITGAGKPSRRKLRRALTAMDLPYPAVAMVGDRLFTDILVGNRLGMFTVLVEPMVMAGEMARKRPIHMLEVWLSQWLGVTLQTSRHR